MDALTQHAELLFLSDAQRQGGDKWTIVDTVLYFILQHNSVKDNKGVEKSNEIL